MCGLFLWLLAALLLLWLVVSLDRFAATGIKVYITMGKKVGETMTALVQPVVGDKVDTTAILTDFTFTFSNPTLYTVTHQSSYLDFQGDVASTGQTLTVAAKNANGEVLTVTVPIPDVEAVVPPAPPVATGLQVTIS